MASEPPELVAYVVLLTTDDYFLGVKVLYSSLKNLRSPYPLLVLYTVNSLLSPLTIRKLQSMGCLAREIKQMTLPSDSANGYAQPYYRDTWAKLQAFNLTDFSRVIMLDADMLLRKNIDELMKIHIPTGWIAASPGCLCNPMNIPSYPSHWRPENCPYTCTETHKQADRIKEHSDGGTSNNIIAKRSGASYFNSGLIVLEPSCEEFRKMELKLLNPDFQLEKYRFPDQDFLNEQFNEKWIQLDYTYNALRPLILSHPRMWVDEEIRVMHYIFVKPWLDKEWISQVEEERKKNVFYEINLWWWDALKASEETFTD